MYNCEVCKYAEWDWSEAPCIKGCALGYKVFSNEECVKDKEHTDETL